MDEAPIFGRADPPRQRNGVWAAFSSRIEYMLQDNIGVSSIRNYAICILSDHLKVLVFDFHFVLYLKKCYMGVCLERRIGI